MRLKSPVRAWLDASRITDNIAGDVIADMRRDSNLPELFHNYREMRAYLRDRGACLEAMEALPEVWRRYRNWLDRHPFAGCDGEVEQSKALA
jgi:hypothetical protein